MSIKFGLSPLVWGAYEVDWTRESGLILALFAPGIQTAKYDTTVEGQIWNSY